MLLWHINFICSTTLSSTEAKLLAFWSLFWGTVQFVIRSWLTWSLGREKSAWGHRRIRYGRKWVTVFQENHLTGGGCGEQKKKRRGDRKCMTGRKEKRRRERERGNHLHCAIRCNFCILGKSVKRLTGQQARWIVWTCACVWENGW